MARQRFFRAIEQIEEVFFTQPKGAPARFLDDDDYDEFDRAMDMRSKRKAAPATIAAVRRQLKKRNVVRYMRLKHDAAWARKELTKMGRNPDELWVVLDG